MCADRWTQLAGIRLAAATLTMLPAVAGTVGVSWDASADATGYRLHYGTVARSYSGQIDVGNSTSYVMTDLDDCTRYYLAVTAYNAAGSSGYSDEVATLARPNVTDVAPPSARRGSQLDVTFTGSNFDAGATVNFSSSGLQVESLSVESCNRLFLSLSVAEDAVIGATDVQVVNPSGATVDLTGLFTVARSVCGDASVDAGEQCDDGNAVDDDACSNSCTINTITNLIVNGDFAAGEAPWTFYTNGSGTFDAVGGEGEVTFGANGTNVQLYQRNIAAAGNTEHTLTFRARHTGSPRRVTVRFQKHRRPFNSYGLSQRVTLTTTMQTHSLTFSTTNSVITDGRLTFLLSAADTPAGAKFIVGDVVLAPSERSTWSTCGNGLSDPGETCDGSNLGGETCASQGFDGGTLACNATCDDFVTSNCSICGDGVVDPGEECDDGNTTSGDGCSDTCQVEGGSGTNLIVNGNFSAGRSSWYFARNANSSFSVVGGEAFIDINTAGSSVQLYQRDILLQPNTTYELTFRGRNTGGDNVRARVIRHTAPYTVYGLNRMVNLTTSMQTFRMTFTTPTGPLSSARLQFWIAPYDVAGNDYYFDDVVLEEE